MQTPLFNQTDVPSPVYLPKEYILSIKTRLEGKRRQLELLPVEIEELAKRYEAAIIFAPPDIDAPQSEAAVTQQIADTTKDAATVAVVLRKRITKPPKVEKPVGWRKGLQTILEESANGIAHQPLLKMAREKYKLPPSSGEKGFYNAIAKLIQAQTVVKHGNLLFAANVIEGIKKNGGTLPAPPEMHRRAGSSAGLIHQVLHGHPEGLTGPALRKLVAELPDAPKSLREHAQYVYNILGTMIGAGDVSKSNGLYRLSSPKKTNGQ